MEHSLQYLASESFSYSWLLNEKPSSLDGLTKSLNEDQIFLAYSKRYLELESQNFNFDISPFSDSSFTLVHADEIFSDGHIMPLYKETVCNFDTCPISSTPLTPFSPFSTRNREVDFIKKQRKTFSRILFKKFKFLWLFCKSLCSSRKCAKVDDLERKVLEIDWAENANKKRNGSRNKSIQKVKSWRNSPEASPIRSPSHSIEVSLDRENTISEAILHCKRSFGMLKEPELSEMGSL
ncbi:probable membrane-associated kinase regulator 6 [Lycium barbarum]|uniref:probable membrane-associated kinase regulator 6 n=1 Tax=Lycium barbarum TaxID=112863 RepID=UPI00293E2086|nr:probable membrane-associated kinase regulator 6 [Lycium barbarum]